MYRKNIMLKRLLFCPFKFENFDCSLFTYTFLASESYFIIYHTSMRYMFWWFYNNLYKFQDNVYSVFQLCSYQNLNQQYLYYKDISW